MKKFLNSLFVFVLALTLLSPAVFAAEKKAGIKPVEKKALKKEVEEIKSDVSQNKDEDKDVQEIVGPPTGPGGPTSIPSTPRIPSVPGVPASAPRVQGPPTVPSVPHTPVNPLDEHKKQLKKLKAKEARANGKKEPEVKAKVAQEKKSV